MTAPNADADEPQDEVAAPEPAEEPHVENPFALEKPSDPQEPKPTDEAPAKEGDRFEDSDPNAESGDDDAAAHRDRMRGYSRYASYSSGDNSDTYQAEQINFYAGEPSVVPMHGAVPGTVLRRLEECYVEPPAARRLLAALSSSPVQCLVGPPSHGRTTTALAVAVRHLRERRLKVDGNVDILAAEQGLGAVTKKTVPDGKALILTLPPDASAPDVAWFGAIAETFRDRGSFMIVISTQEPAGAAVLRDELTVRYEPPPVTAVFRRHLRRLGDAEADRISTLPEVRDAVRGCATPRTAALLAVEVLDNRNNGLPDSELLSGEPSDHLASARKELRESELWDRILLVASTVMADLSAGSVTREAFRLAELHKPNDVQADGPKVEWFTGPERWPSSIKLGDASAEGAGRTVRLSHPRLSVPLLRAIWEDHVGERDVLLPWLYGLGLHPHKRVRVKAAQAVAQLACYDFDVVMREVLQVWAIDGQFRSRESCALALEALAVAADGRFAKRVRGQVRGWAGSNSVALRATAVAVYGTFLGAQDPDEALSRIREIAGSKVFRGNGQWRAAEQAEAGLANIVLRAVIDVFNAGAQEKVIHALAGWADIPAWRWRRAAARGLRELARLDGAGPWPLLVELSVVQDSTYDAVLRLWRNALEAKHRDEASWEALRRWLKQAQDLRNNDSAGSLRAVVQRLEADLRAGSPDLGRHLDFHQQIWKFRERRRTDSTPFKEIDR
ncbi:hypothetical protein [Dactylosporangium matsuzakiense]|uniref:Uncharacterized protein n=1 Tax=Dactylosporangium matsuzakiense TaxID=53360 RepID=A0A9W6KRI6_9ACTN|nr:hypothetical protein [Dactylosporangium matsuzakiense]UWZ44582.1 hypothetical protein Dmats_45795 [Dactylosporangium matsuzakiense]GLL05344.1 hypothetical protein GCM10017581_070910 [Dactylosporangium matsuzakiense]